MLELVTAPVAELVSTSDAKDWLRVTSSAEDTLIASLSKAARVMCEEYTSRRFITQTWRLWEDLELSYRKRDLWEGVREGHIGEELELQQNFISLKLAPIISVGSVKYYDRDNNESTWDSASYLVDGNYVPGRLVLNDGYTWPNDLRVRKSLNITFDVGYGATASFVPEPIIVAVKLMLAHLYSNRGDSCGGEMPSAVKKLLDPYVIKVL